MNTEQLSQVPEDLYSAWEIESVIDILLDKAKETGEAHSAIMVSIGRSPTPRAYQATTSYKAIEIIRQLQKELSDIRERGVEEGL